MKAKDSSYQMIVRLMFRHPPGNRQSQGSCEKHRGPPRLQYGQKRPVPVRARPERTDDHHLIKIHLAARLKCSQASTPIGIKQMHQNSSAMLPPLPLFPFAMLVNMPVMGMMKQLRKKTP